MTNNTSIVLTEDGSSTIISPIFKERYHSKYGAQTESQVVFLDAGLNHFANLDETICVLEMGFGSGLNALMTWEYADSLEKKVSYTGYEKYPIKEELATELNYGKLYKSQREFLSLHTSKVKQTHSLSSFFQFELRHEDIETVDEKNKYHVIYFDAFAPSAQEELWTTEIFSKLYASLKSGGVIVTYCAKGQVKRNLKAAGFSVEGLPGPPGKREMTRAIKH